MRRHGSLAVLTTLVAASVAVLAPAAGRTVTDGAARFDWVDYRGVEPVVAPRAGTYRNPILPGFYPDPSIVRVGRDFYLVTSTFAWWPGLPIFHSRDLVNWHQIGSGLSHPDKLAMDVPVSRGLYAPDISYHDGRFFIVSTCVECGGNFVVTATKPGGPWSDPVWLKDVDGFDPSLFFDRDGAAWLVNHAAPAGGARYRGHGAIWLRRFDPVALRTVGAPTVIVEGGLEPAKKPAWIEGPHIFVRDGRYYLTLAEGGTGINHSQVIFGADRVEGPWHPAPLGRQPILTQRDLDPARADPISATGHADLVELDGDRWWAVFLATRPYRDDLYNTGRETFLLPVTWRDGWPVILERGAAVPALLRRPDLPASPAAPTPPRDDFTGGTLGAQWMTLRGPPSPAWMRLARGALHLSPRAVPLGGMGRPSLIARRLQHADATISTALHLDPGPRAAAGLVAIHSELFFVTAALVRDGTARFVEVRRRDGERDPLEGALVARIALAEDLASIELRMHLHGASIDIDYALEPGRWRPISKAVDATILSPRPGSFVGTMIGPFAAAQP